MAEKYQFLPDDLSPEPTYNRDEDARHPDTEVAAACDNRHSQEASVEPQLLQGDGNTNGKGRQLSECQPGKATHPKDLALRYASMGLAVFPLIGKQPPANLHWRDVSTFDEDEISLMFDSNERNVGCDCAKSRIVVIDLDVKNDDDGLATWAELKRELGFDDSQAWISRTGSGGQHLAFRDPTNGKIRNSTGKLGPGIDVKASGGYFVLPGSIHPETGESYQELNVWCDQPGNPPPELIEMLVPPEGESQAQQPIQNPQAYAAAALEEELSALAETPEGKRNDQLNRSAFSLGQLVAEGWIDRTVAEGRLLDIALEIGLGKREAENTIKSGIEAGIARPRTFDMPQESQTPATADTDGPPENVEST